MYFKTFVFWFEINKRRPHGGFKFIQNYEYVNDFPSNIRNYYTFECENYRQSKFEF